MEKNVKIFLIVIGVLIAALIIWGLISYFSKGNRKGRAAERKVAGVLKKLGKNDNIRIINNAFLPLYRKTVEIDHLVFGRFGVLRARSSLTRSALRSISCTTLSSRTRPISTMLLTTSKRVDSTQLPSTAPSFSQTRT